MTIKAYDYMKQHKVTFKTIKEKFEESGVDSYNSTENILFAIYTPDKGKTEQLVIQYTVEEDNVFALYNAQSGRLVPNVVNITGKIDHIKEQIKHQE